MNEFHLYRGRHLFRNDDCIGKFDYRTRTLRLFAVYAHMKEEAAAYFRAKQSINARVLTGDEEPEADKPPVALPDEIAAMCQPEKGIRTPEVMRWCSENWPLDQFREVFHCDPPCYVEEPPIVVTVNDGEDTKETESTQQPKRRGRKPNPKN